MFRRPFDSMKFQQNNLNMFPSMTSLAIDFIIFVVPGMNLWNRSQIQSLEQIGIPINGLATVVPMGTSCLIGSYCSMQGSAVNKAIGFFSSPAPCTSYSQAALIGRVILKMKKMKLGRRQEDMLVAPGGNWRERIEYGYYQDTDILYSFVKFLKE